MLVWPEETVLPDRGDIPKWCHTGSNLCLDFHGDPLTAKLVVFSDGNHHMALMETLQYFYKNNPEVEQIFYATTPPGPVLKLLKHGSLQIGNFILSAKPHVFISPLPVLDNLVNEGYMQQHMPFMQNRGNVLLIKKGNPKNISGIADLARTNVRLFLSNPKTEAMSYKGYVDTLKGIAAREDVNLSFLSDELSGTEVEYGERIHHREAPQAIMDGRADVAIVYYHLALRYTRIFPSLFEVVPLGGTTEDPQPVPENVISLTHAGIIGDGGQWGSQFLHFLSSKLVSEIYSHHGLLRAKP
ncbi:MAG: substrate-binding domain-containing protein [Desulfobacterales bacterium]|uniref:Substrate-binding domain-containing protein n=1 Tax=Candidatus Desulfaltia bathyphila TaxID=2841697 RepID=A0A8J6TB22_9BACT|nr:substrate-binding domain-containing protein [Candidatus Desulfaltia bathyphila]MBL7196360.1 substrate-binding domain-containing protein [Desulfobacterales bacterium]MBL7207974.1 substrate-binding domain-containing protein [Desulfobacterales bacterium]